MDQHAQQQVAYAQRLYESSLAKVVKLLRKKGVYRITLSAVGTVDSVSPARNTAPKQGTFVLRVLGGGQPPRFGHFELLGKWQLGAAKAFKLDVGRLYKARSLADLEELALANESNGGVPVTDTRCGVSSNSDEGTTASGCNKKTRRTRRRKKNRKKSMEDKLCTDIDDASSTATDTTSSSHSSPSFAAFSPAPSTPLPFTDIRQALAAVALDDQTDDEDESAFARDALKMTAAVTSAASPTVSAGGRGLGSACRNARERVLELEARFGKLPDSAVASAMERSLRQASEEQQRQKQRAEIFESISTNLFDDYVLQEKKRMERAAKAGGQSRYPRAASCCTKRTTRALSISSASSASLSSASQSPPPRGRMSAPSALFFGSELECLR